MTADTDTGTLAEVPPEDRLEVDEGEGANALEDPDRPGPDDDLQDVYDDPGQVVEEDLG